ncbi:uncharacterized protein LOC144742512 isoform X2 [Ciona intestinalis]
MTFNFDKCHGITFKIEKEDEDRFNKKKVRPFQAETTQAGSSHSSGPSRQGARGGFIPFKKFVFLKRKKIIPANKRWVPYHQVSYMRMPISNLVDNLHFFFIVYGSKTECEKEKGRGGTEGESGGEGESVGGSGGEGGSGGGGGREEESGKAKINLKK